MQKYEKSILEYSDPNSVPKTTPTLLSFADFQFSVLGDSISINKFVVIVLRKIGKTL